MLGIGVIRKLDYWAEWYVWEPSRWQVYSYGYAFITDINATTRNATYFNYYIFKTDQACHGSTPYSGTTPDNGANFVSYIDQLSYSDQWVRLWYLTAAVKCVDLVDWTGESNATKRVGFDEVKLEW